ncbi:MAG TPA: serine/threonine-protein kinase [Gemmatimonadales bacterium]|nr:serine/threonine-protein kinase [Gemmatimonadales bacterium]
MTDPLSQPLVQRLSEALGGLYTIEGEIGRGGMGVVYRARDEKLKRRVAIKVLPPELAFQADIRARFAREAETSARLSHPHIVPIFAVGEGNGLVYFIMGYVDGESLAARIRRRGQLPPEEARRIMKETADALSAAHALSVIHRDIKPDNILLEGTRGRVMVTDFGIAKAMSSSSGGTLTSAGVAIGTPQFMSPEQAAGEREIDGRSDLYSLGVVTYQMLTGDLPFNAPTVAGILMKQITEVAPSVADRRADAPEDLVLAVARCLEKDPENRWPTADALRRALESRLVTGYRPTGTSRARPSTAASRAGSPPPASSRLASPPSALRRPSLDRPPGGRPRIDAPGNQLERAGRQLDRLDRASRRTARRSGQDENTPLPDTGEPRIVVQTRAQFAKWATVSGGLLMLDIVTGHGFPEWSLVVAGVWFGFGLLPQYTRLWQAGYSWKDVMSRPPAHDAIEAKVGTGGKIGRQPPAPTAAEFGAFQVQALQVHGDRAAIYKLLDKMPPAERKMLPEEVPATVDGLYGRALDLARTLNAMDTNVGLESVTQIDDRIAAIQREPEDEERTRRLNLLERKKKAIRDLEGRREQVASQLESCVLAMQTVRFDLIRLRSSDANAAMGDLTTATRQAKALSRDVDNAIAAASEIREAMS